MADLRPARGGRRLLAWGGGLAIGLCSGCSVVAGVSGLEYDLDPDEATTASGAGGSGGGVTVAAASGTGGANGPGNGGATSTASSAASTGSGAGGGAGNPVVCGDGVIGNGEECDDQNANADDGCDACLVVCSAAGEFEDPATHHCYYLAGRGTSHSGADALCAARGSTVAAISSQAEQDLIEGHIGANASIWIGAIAPNSDGVFVWSNGEPWGYTNWLAGKPDNGAGNEDCVKLRGDGYWDDNACNQDRTPLCERAPAGTAR